MTLALTAQNLEFIPQSLRAPAGAGFRISFRNQDAGVDHSVAIRDSGGTRVFDPGTPITGVKSTVYSVRALTAGTYTFFCTVHAFMTGNLTVS